MIKKLIYATLCCFAVLALGCSQEGEDNFDFSINRTSLHIDAVNPGIETINLVSSVSWQITVSDPWLKVTPMSGEGNCTILISAEDNDTKFWRTATVSVVVNHKVHLAKDVQIVQYGLDEVRPADAGPIYGADYNDCPYDLELYTDPIAGAESYVWFCDGVRVAETAEPVVTIVATGTGSFAFKVAGKNSAGEGTPSVEKRVELTLCPIPDDAGPISGANDNVCPEIDVLLTIDPIVNAVTYQWYKDGVAIPGATTTEYLVTASGTYNAAGVNGTGEGTWSPDHIVDIIDCP